jgi:ribosome biogenesis protein Tsr3
METIAREVRTGHVDDRRARQTGKRVARLARIVRAEYREMPGLILTPSQAARLWSEDAGVMERLLTDLVRDGFLVRDPQGAYRRFGCPRCS